MSSEVSRVSLVPLRRAVKGFNRRLWFRSCMIERKAAGRQIVSASRFSMRVHLHFSLKTWPLLPTLGIMLGSAAPQSSHVTCPECGTTRVKKLLKRDPIDRSSAVPWSRIQRSLGGRLYHCSNCRLQFYDCRKQTSDSHISGTPTVR